jgi:hypothetical protein
VWTPKYRYRVLEGLVEPLSKCCDNGSERAIRNLKVKQKISGGFRSDRGAEIFAVLRSVVDTIIKKGEIHLKLSGLPSMLLLVKMIFLPLKGIKH